jgi:replicative DNA helicase
MRDDMDSMQTESPKFVTQDEARIRWLKSLEARDHRRYFKSGFKAHEQSIGAFLRGSFNLFAARPGVGKTAFLFALAYRQVLAGVKAYFCNLEMGVEQMWNRLACLHDESLTLRELNEGEVTNGRAHYFMSLSEKLAGFSPLFFESTELRALIAATQAEIKPSSDSILFIDYIGLFTDKRLGPQERYWLISECAKVLKLLARQLDIPVIAAVQLNRQLENRKDKTPTLADLRDSGELENHADAVFALTREDRGVLEVDCLKNRHGPLASYSLRFDGPRVALEEFD